MSSFHPVYTSMYDPTFARLSRSAQTLELYIRTAPNRSTEGLFHFGAGAVADYLGMEREEVFSALSELQEADRPFMFDAEAGVILDRSAVRDNPLGKRKTKDEWPADQKKNLDNRIKGAIRKLKALPKTPLLLQLLIVADAHSPEFAEAMRDEFDLPEPDTDSYLQASTKAPSKPLTKPRVEKESESESSSEEEEKSSDPLRDLISAFDAEEIGTFEGASIESAAIDLRNWNASLMSPADE